MSGACAGLRRPGAAALDLCYVAAGWYDGFFETGLNPWDMAAGSLMITEAGGLVGNFTGDADFLYQREVVAGNPKVYGQLVALLAPYSKAIKADEAGDAVASPAQSNTGALATAAAALAGAALAGAALADQSTASLARPGGDRGSNAAADAASNTAGTSATDPAAPSTERERKPVRIRKQDAAPGSTGTEPVRSHRGPRTDPSDRPRHTGKPAPGRPLPPKR